MFHGSSQEGVAHEAVVVADRVRPGGLWRGTCSKSARPRRRAGGGSVPSLAPSPTVQAMQSSFPLFSPTIPNTVGDPTATSGSASAGGIFSSPMAAPMLYSSMMGASMPQNQASGAAGTGAGSPNLSAAQYGMLMMMANQQNGGIGSGRLSGLTGNATQPTSPGGTKPASSTKARTSNRPGGLASRYFNRTNVRSSASQELLQPATRVTSPDRRRSGVPVVFDLSKRAIVPIVSPVKTDAATDAGRARGQEPKRRGTGRFPR